jgi:hypothetical protein
LSVSRGLSSWSMFYWLLCCYTSAQLSGSACGGACCGYIHRR